MNKNGIALHNLINEIVTAYYYERKFSAEDFENKFMSLNLNGRKTVTGILAQYDVVEMDIAV